MASLSSSDRWFQTIECCYTMDVVIFKTKHFTLLCSDFEGKIILYWKIEELLHLKGEILNSNDAHCLDRKALEQTFWAKILVVQ